MKKTKVAPKHTPLGLPFTLTPKLTPLLLTPNADAFTKRLGELRAINERLLRNGETFCVLCGEILPKTDTTFTDHYKTGCTRTDFPHRINQKKPSLFSGADFPNPLGMMRKEEK